MLRNFRKKLWHLCSRVRWIIWRKRRPKVFIKKFGKLNFKVKQMSDRPDTCLEGELCSALLRRPIRIATFNAALFSLAQAVPKAEDPFVFLQGNTKIDGQKEPLNHPLKSILKLSPLHPSTNGSNTLSNVTKSKQKVSINLPDNEISLAHYKSSSDIMNGSNIGGGLMRSPVCIPFGMTNWMNDESLRGTRTILDVLKEVGADILALQDVKAEEEKNMKPLSDLAYGLGMNYVFAESWAPEYGNAILSKWPIKKWKAQRIFDDQDFRNVLKATIDVPWTGELNVYSTQLDHLDENWRMKQINAIIQSSDRPHILAGGLNSLDGSDYSSDRWTDIVKYYEDIGKPTPKVEVMKFLKEKEYVDAKWFAGECEPVVIMAKGQDVQGTCKYGTRVDYIMASQDLAYEFVPDSYSVISSKGTSDHHIVKVDVRRVVERGCIRKKKFKQMVARRIRNNCSSGGIWRNED